MPDEVSVRIMNALREEGRCGTALAFIVRVLKRSIVWHKHNNRHSSTVVDVFSQNVCDSSREFSSQRGNTRRELLVLRRIRDVRRREGISNRRSSSDLD